MSCRSLVGGLTDGGTYCVYIHDDGRPQYRLPVLADLISRDGVHGVLGTLLTARYGGWSYLDPSEDGTRENLLGKRARSVPGYGLAYTAAALAHLPPDQQVQLPIRFPDNWSEDYWADYVYLIEDDGSIRWARTTQRAPQDWRWKLVRPVGADEQWALF